MLRKIQGNHRGDGSRFDGLLIALDLLIRPGRGCGGRQSIGLPVRRKI
jgi:hypothetical protein